MFKKMLVATDFLAASECFVCNLGSFKKIGTRAAVLIHCFNIRDVAPMAQRLMEIIKPSFERQNSKPV